MPGGRGLDRWFCQQHGTQLLVLDDLTLDRLGSTETTDFYEPIVERHRKAATIVTSNREPPEILTMMADPLLAQSAMDRLQSAAYELVVEGESYRLRQKPTITPDPSSGVRPHINVCRDGLSVPPGATPPTLHLYGYPVVVPRKMGRGRLSRAFTPFLPNAV